MLLPAGRTGGRCAGRRLACRGARRGQCGLVLMLMLMPPLRCEAVARGPLRTHPALPSCLQALCMVASWPFYPDQRQLADALRGKAGQLWEQLRRTSA